MKDMQDEEALDEITRRLTAMMIEVEAGGEDGPLYDRLQPIKPKLRRVAQLAAYITRQLGG
jgi:hypothetical protein